MLKSMTGFGRGEYCDKEHRFLIEIKAVNHRYNEIVIRMPKNLSLLEDRIRRCITKVLTRGRIDVFISMDEYSQQGRTVRIDKELAMAYDKALRELSQEICGLDNNIDNQHVLQIARYSDVLKVEDVLEDVEGYWPKLSEAITVAIENHLAMRQAEGSNIEQDLRLRIRRIQTWLGEVEERAPQVVADYREKFNDRVRELLSGNAPLDEGRIMQEVAIFADRINITEEIVRLKSHLSQFDVNLSQNGAVGRKLDFIVQEMNRETNTIASKANDYKISNVVVEIKSEIEKIREQIQNVE